MLVRRRLPTFEACQYIDPLISIPDWAFDYVHRFRADMRISDWLIKLPETVEYLGHAMFTSKY